MNRISIVQACLEHTSRSMYVEIGVNRGECFSRIAADTKIAVDPHFRIPWWRRRLSERRAAASHYVASTSDEFFRSRAAVLCAAGIDVALIDGLHTWEQAHRDVANTLAHLNEGGVIVLHDCNPVNPIIAQPFSSFEEFRKAHPWRVRWSGDVWKAVVLLRSTRPDLEVVVLDCDYGVGLVKRGKAEAVLDLGFEAIREMDYEDLRTDRQRLLNLRAPGDLHRFLRTGSSAGGAGA